MTAPNLDQVQLQQLRELPMEILVPGDLPEGFAVRDVQAEDDPEWGASYRLLFARPDGATFHVEGTTGGLGDVMRGESRRKFENPALGAGVIEFYAEDSEEPVDFRSHWLQVDPELPAYGLAGKGMDPDLVVRLAEGLHPLA